MKQPLIPALDRASRAGGSINLNATTKQIHVKNGVFFMLQRLIKKKKPAGDRGRFETSI